MTDANGQATIDVVVPADRRISYTYTKEGYLSVLYTDVVDETLFTDRSHWTLTDAQMKELSDAVMTPYPFEGTGSLVVSQGLSGATFELVGASGKAYYFDAQGVPSLDLTSTTINGQGGFAEVAPDEVEVRLGGTATNCTPLSAWPGSEANTLRMPIKVGFLSWSSMSCDATVELTVTATDGAVGLEGVKLCEFGTDTDTDNCDTTDGNGNASIRLPANQEISYTLSKDPFVPYLIGDVTDETFRDSGPWPMGDEETAASWADAVMLPDLWTDGFLMLRAFPKREGLTLDLVDETAMVYYFDGTGTPTVGLSATTTDGSGGFAELSTGEYQAEFGGNATNCIPDLGWPGDTPNRIRAPVKLGHLTFASTNCDEP